MGSLGAMVQGVPANDTAKADTDAAGTGKLVPEGVEGRVPFKGPLDARLYTSS